MKLISKSLIGTVCLLFAFTACTQSAEDPTTEPVEESKKEETPAEPFAWESFDFSKKDSYGTTYTLTEENDDTSTYAVSGKTITLKGNADGSGAKYTISGYFDGVIINEIKDNELVLDGAYLTNVNDAVIKCSKKLQVSAKNETVNYIVSTGTNENKLGAIHSEKGLEFGGKGTCYVVGSIYHAVKGSNVELKGSGTYYFQGTDKGAGINCNNFEVKAEKEITAYFINSKNGIKADETVNISSGTFYFGNVKTGIKTDLKADDAAEDPKSHYVKLIGGTFYYNADDVEAFVITDENQYAKSEAAKVNELSNRKSE